MRSILISFLIAFLPLQTSWAMIAVYNGHSTSTITIGAQNETTSGLAAAHMGHHEHDAHLTVSEAKNLEDNSVTSVDSDCNVCHVACCNIILLALAGVPALDLNTHHLSQPTLLALNDYVAEIERPIWQPTL